MNVGQLLVIASEGATVLQAIVWLLFAIGVFAYFRRPMLDFMKQAEVLKLKFPGGMEAIMQKQVELGATLGAAEATKGAPDGGGNELTPDQLQKIVQAVDHTFSRRAGKRLSDADILWVDDRPSNNTYEQRSFESLGVHVDLARSTDEALAQLRKGRRYDVIISDMGRPPDAQAGYTLLRALRKMGNHTPFVIYAAGGNRPENRAKARSEGALDSTNDPAEVFELVIEAIKGDAGHSER